MNIISKIEHDESGFIVQANLVKKGLFGTKNSPLEFDRWKDNDFPKGTYGRVALKNLLENQEAEILSDGKLRITDKGAASLNLVEANSLGLPEVIPYNFEIKTQDHIASDNYKIWYSFYNKNNQPIATTKSGSAITVGDNFYRLAKHIYEVIEAISKVSGSKNKDQRLANIGLLLSLLPQEISKNISIDDSLDSIKLIHAQTFGLKIIRRNGILEIDPIPFSDYSNDVNDELFSTENDTLNLLSSLELKKFQNEFRQSNNYDVHVLSGGTYLYIDPGLRPILDIVKRKQSAGIEELVSFAQNPEREIKKILGDEVPPNTLRFVETQEYSDRVTEIGPWIPPSLPFIKGESNNWLPERFSILIGGKLITLEPKEIPKIISNVEQAIIDGDDYVVIDDVEIEAKPDTISVLKELDQTSILPDIVDEALNEESEETLDKPEPKIINTHSNFFEDDFNKQLKPRGILNDLNAQMRSTLRVHQIEALDWLKLSYKWGRPGVLLADDMGLGKTIEVLAFLSWLQENIAQKLPILIVAPTSLLRNWEDEHSKHLFKSLGLQTTAYGPGLRNLRIELGNEFEAGRDLLNIEAMQGAGFILTTYETLRDYQFSFAKVKFSVAVYDETQKVKNPKVRMHAAAKSINADFSIAMTGTPVENAMSDLWAIADLVSPGMLCPLQKFVKECNIQNIEKLRELRNELLDAAADGRPPFILRRMKTEVVDLTDPEYYPNKVKMGDLQAEKYQLVVNKAKANGGSDMLRALHDMRSISLSPIDPTEISILDDKEFIDSSARLKNCFEILNEIEAKDEKVLIFLNSRKIQDVLSDLIQRYFKMDKAPLIIRGDTPANRRQDFVNEFSESTGFNVLLLSPRAAGVGLNITAASNVIHLDRWWNPAVEDQCTARSHRIGQEKQVKVYLPIAYHPGMPETSYDIILDDILSTKRELASALFIPADVAKELVDKILSKKNKPDDEFLSRNELQIIDDRGAIYLEDWVKKQCKQAGLAVEGTKVTGDGGVDLIIRNANGDITHLIQCKHTGAITSPVEGGIIKDLSRAGKNWNVANACFVAVTNANSFSPKATNLLKQSNSLIVTRGELSNFVNKLSITRSSN
ncbi:MAG: SNF2-related protein [Hyphomicrobiales bacterium]